MIGERLRERRLELGLSQRQLAGEETTRNYISMIESGRATPSNQLLRVLAFRLRTTVEELNVSKVQDSTTVRALLSTARHMFEEHNYAIVVDICREILSSPINVYELVETKEYLIKSLKEEKRYEEALRECNSVLPTLKQIDDKRRIIEVHSIMGAVSFMTENYTAACEHYENASMFSSGKLYQEIQVDALTYLGTSYLRVGKLSKAIETYHKAHELCQLNGYRERHGKIAMGLSKVYFLKTDLDMSLKWVKRAIEIFSEVSTENVVLALHNMASIYSARGTYKEAETLLKYCLKVYELRGDEEREASILEELAQHSLRLNQWVQAKAYIYRALEHIDEIDHSALCGRLYRVLGTIFSEDKNYIEAEMLFRASYHIFKILKLEHECRSTKALLSDTKSKIKLKTGIYTQ